MRHSNDTRTVGCRCVLALIAVIMMAGSPAAQPAPLTAGSGFNASMTIVCLDQDERELGRWSGPIRWAAAPSTTPITYLGSNYNGALVWVSEPPAASAIRIGMASDGSGGTPIKQWIHPDTQRIRMTVQAMPAAPALSMPPASSPDEVLYIRMGTSQPYINDVATRVTYDGMDNTFIIHYRRADGAEGEVHVPHWLFTDERVIVDVLEYSRTGVSVPARYTPYMVPRLWPYMRDARDKWSRQFDEMAYASTGMLATATILTLRPLTAPAVAPAIAPAITAAQPRVRQPQARTPAAQGGRPLNTTERSALLKAATQPFKDGRLTEAGRALTKHPELLGLTKDSLRTTLRTEAAINAAAENALGGILQSGTYKIINIARYGRVLEVVGSSGYGARFYADTGKFIGFINP